MFMQHLADVAAPLHNITPKDVAYYWNNECNRTFQKLKDKLVGALILGCTLEWTRKQANFTSKLGLGAVSEKGGCVTAYVSRIQLLCDTARVVSCSQCSKAIQTLSAWAQYPTVKWSKTAAVVVWTKNGRHAVLLGSSFYRSIIPIHLISCTKDKCLA